ncbi:MAG: ATP-binding protein [Actinomycetota bacterium]|nr:ATP-binding protein [Actinomycetota bacterium]
MEATRSFEPEPEQVLAARHFVAGSLERWGLINPDVALLVSELATNAVLHARSEFEVCVAAAPERIRVEVSDFNTRLPTIVSVPPDACSGRGLMLLQALAGSWGVETHPNDGKTIWFEVPTGGS